MLSGLRRRAWRFRRGATKARRRCRLQDACYFDKGLPRTVVRMARRFIEVEHWRKADIGAFHHRAPLVAGLRFDDGCEFGFQLRPTLRVHLRLKVRIGDAGLFEQQRVKLRLNGTDGNPLAIGALVGFIKVRAAVEQVRAFVVRPSPQGVKAVHHRHQCCRAIGHRGINHLPFARCARFEQRTDDAESEQQSAAAEIANQIERRHRVFVRSSDGMQHAA